MAEGMADDARESFDDGPGLREVAVALAGVSLTAFVLYGVLVPGSLPGSVVRIAVRPDTLSAALRTAVPIAFAALGGIYAEKAGVINIGLEGLLIIAAFTGVLVTDLLGPDGALLFAIPGAGVGVAVPNIWVGFLGAVIASTALSLLFAVVCIEFQADQIIAGLAVWLIALGLAPFASNVVYGTVNSASVGTLSTWTVPGLSSLPYLGPVFFDALPTVYMLLLAVPLSWWVLNRTAFGARVRASGENPKALDTAGVSVPRVRYVAVLISGVLSGIGGASLSLGQVGLFIGSGQTMVNGKGFIGIVAYLFGNYNPFGAFGASVLFSGLEALQIRIQGAGVLDVPESLVQTIPFVVVIVVLVLVGETRIPDAAGDHYESGED